MEFSEANKEWRDIPDWAVFLIEMGFGWLAKTPVSRRIAVISMPSDSAAAGLIALGAMRKCLEFDDANDLGTHFQRIATAARHRTNGGQFRHVNKTGQFAPDGVDADGNPWVRKVSDSRFRIRITRKSAIEWQFSGEAPVTILHGQQVPNSQLYRHLVKHGQAIKPSNLSQSDSEVCLAGRGVGETSTRKSMADIRFRDNGCETDLRQLLTVQDWMPGTISRVLFFNSRTEEFDRGPGRPHLVVADGDASFLKVVARPEFEQSDIVGVIHRTMERDRLEAIGTKLANLRQWYDPDDLALDWLPDRPRGIAISVLRRRA